MRNDFDETSCQLSAVSSQERSWQLGADS